MKKYFMNWVTFFMVAILSVGFASCSSDDDEKSPKYDVTGIWVCYETNSDDGGFEVGDGFNLLANGRGMLSWNAYDFTDPSTWYEDMEEWDWWTLEGNKLTVMECDLDRFVGTIVIEGNEMTFTYKYQDWVWEGPDSKGGPGIGHLVKEDPFQYVSKFRKQ